MEFPDNLCDLDSANKYEIDEHIHLIEKQINEGNYEGALFYSRLFINKNLPCKISLELESKTVSLESFDKTNEDSVSIKKL